MTSYNGHPSYNAWNVALWLGNDEGLYHMARRAIRSSRSLDQAAHKILGELSLGDEVPMTPDGVKYTFSNIRRSISRDF